MKHKWLNPFIPTIVLVSPPPPDFVLRVTTVIGVLICVEVYLMAAQPWREDRG